MNNFKTNCSILVCFLFINQYLVNYICMNIEQHKYKTVLKTYR